MIAPRNRFTSLFQEAWTNHLNSLPFTKEEVKFLYRFFALGGMVYNLNSMLFAFLCGTYRVSDSDTQVFKNKIIKYSEYHKNLNKIFRKE